MSFREFVGSIWFDVMQFFWGLDDLLEQLKQSSLSGNMSFTGKTMGKTVVGLVFFTQY